MSHRTGHSVPVLRRNLEPQGCLQSRLPDVLVEALREAGFVGLHLPHGMDASEAWSTRGGDSSWAQIRPIIEGAMIANPTLIERP